jgi:hypothetical protein
MATAVIGLVGVIAGALLGGLFSINVDRLKERRRAIVAGRLISTELGTIGERMRAAAKKGYWWAADLPTEAWKTQRDSLAVLHGINRSIDLTIEKVPETAPTAAGQVSKSSEEHSENQSASADDAPTTATSTTVLIELAETYATVESWNGDRAASVPTAPPGSSAPVGAIVLPAEKINTELSESAQEVDKAQTALNKALAKVDTPFRRALGPWGVLVAWLIGAAVVFLLGVAAFAQRPDLTAETVATTMENYYGQSTLVTCDPAGIDWTCTVYDLNGTRQSCLAATGHALPQQGAAVPRPNVTLAAEVTADCPVKTVTKQPVDHDGSDLILPGQAERAGRGNRVLHGHTRNFLQSKLDELRGRG